MKSRSSAVKRGFCVSLIAGFLAAGALAVLPPGAAAQVEPEKLDLPQVGGTLAVLTTYADGTVAEVFNRQNPPVFDINFTLALSATNSYPMRLTFIQDGVETVIWSGTLEEGYYRLRYPAPDMPATGGEVNVKIVMRVRMFVKQYNDASSYQYYTWEGAYRVGKR